MRVEVYQSLGSPTVSFIVHAENAVDRAVLTNFTRSTLADDYQFGIGGYTYECDHSAVTSFNFGWAKKAVRTRKAKSIRKRRRA